MSTHIDNQEQITEWFNNTYTKRGSWYLRPVHAYYIYLEILKAKADQKLLDIACGLGRLLDASQDYNVEPYGIDISDVAISKAKERFPNFNLSVANAERIPFDDNSFDLITCIGSLERMLNTQNALKEMLRVGKQNSKYCFLVRNSETTSWQFFKTFLGLKNKKGHQDAKNLKEWTSIFEAAGFDVVNVYPDQYPLMKKARLKNLWLKNINYKEIIKNHEPIEKANEFLFLLKKA
nr:class I SAM-dependent methyltransferase [uncultured Psychroserpens sp.]